MPFIPIGGHCFVWKVHVDNMQIRKFLLLLSLYLFKKQRKKIWLTDYQVNCTFNSNSTVYFKYFVGAQPHCVVVPAIDVNRLLNVFTMLDDVITAEK